MRVTKLAAPGGRGMYIKIDTSEYSMSVMTPNGTAKDLVREAENEEAASARALRRAKRMREAAVELLGQEQS